MTKRLRPLSKRVERILFIPDTHFPFEDKRAWGLMLKAARAFKPNIICVLGDFVDCYSVSQHSKDPSRVHALDEEIAAANTGLDQLDALGAKRSVFVSGNHEHRLQRYLEHSAPALSGMVKIKDLLRLKERGWGHVDYRQHVQIGSLYVTHDVGNAGAVAHTKAKGVFNSSAVIGHTHRCSTSYTIGARGITQVGAMFGCLLDMSKADYMHAIQLQQWHLGFGIGYLEPSGLVHLQAVPIIDGTRCVIEGRIIRA